MKKWVIFVYLMGQFCSIKAQNVTLTSAGINAPKMSYDAIIALPSPEEGQIAYDLTFKCLRVFSNGKWIGTFQKPGDLTPNIWPIASAGGTNADYGNGIAVDGSGNVYITGYYKGTANFGSTSTISAGAADIFVAKYNNSGVLQWLQSAGGTGDDYGNGIAVDGSGNVYITGYYTGTVNFSGTTKPSAGGQDIFVAKYDTNGAFQWVQTSGSTATDAGQGIIVDGSGNVYVTGYYSGTANLGGTNKISAGGSDVFILKYNTGGGILLVLSAGGTSDDKAFGIALDGSGYMYITGYYYGTTNFGGTNKTSAGVNDIFVAKCDPSGLSWAWIQSAGGTSNETGYSIAVDGSGNVYITGGFNGTASFSGSTVTSAGSYDIFVAKYNTSGTPQWVQEAGGVGADIGFGITVDGNGNVYATGYYQVASTFGSTPPNSGGGNYVYVMKYKTSGTMQWVQSAGGGGLDQGNGIALDSIGSVYITGFYSSTAIFGATSITALASNQDIFIARLDN